MGNLVSWVIWRVVLRRIVQASTRRTMPNTRTSSSSSVASHQLAWTYRQRWWMTSLSSWSPDLTQSPYHYTYLSCSISWRVKTHSWKWLRAIWFSQCVYSTVRTSYRIRVQLSSLMKESIGEVKSMKSNSSKTNSKSCWNTAQNSQRKI